jgi:hypothetical protein
VVTSDEVGLRHRIGEVAVEKVCYRVVIGQMFERNRTFKRQEKRAGKTTVGIG